MLGILISVSFILGGLAFLAYLLRPDRFKRRGISWLTALSPAFFSGVAIEFANRKWPVLAWCFEGFSLLLVLVLPFSIFRSLDIGEQERHRGRARSEEYPFPPAVKWTIYFLVIVAMEVFWIREARKLAWWAFVLLSLCAIQVAVHLHDSRDEAKSNE